MITAAQLNGLFSLGEPFTRDAQLKFGLTVDTSLQIASNVLGVAPGGISASHLASGSVTPSALAINSGDVPHSSASVLATTVKTGLEEVALGYLARVQRSGGTMSGPLDMGANKISNVADPTAGLDVVNLRTVNTAVSRGDYYFTPTTYGNPTGLNGTLKVTWIRASASFYFSGIPTIGDTITIHGVTFIFDTTGLPGTIMIGLDVATTVANAVAALNVDTRITSDLIPFNHGFWSAQDSGIGAAFHVIVTNEDPPNTPEDGDKKTSSEVSTAISRIGFRGGLNVAKDGMIVIDAFTNTMYTYDAMQPAAPWIPVQGAGGAVDATLVTYTGPPLSNIPVAPLDNLQDILIAIDAAFGSVVVPLHASTHELGGLDELVLTGMSGLLATAQTPVTHKGSHEDTGLDEIDVTALSGLLADPQDAGSIRGVNVHTAAPNDGDILVYSLTATRYEPTAQSGMASPVILSNLTDATGLAVGNLVRISAANTVLPADASVAGTMPCVGMIHNIPGPNLVDVTIVGKVVGLAGLSAGTEYYVDTSAGGYTAVVPSGAGEVLQRIGIALNATTMLILPITYVIIT